ncbi:MAG: serine hydrolase domain-containing protein [Gemmatimonadaceae bacterium]
MRNLVVIVALIAGPLAAGAQLDSALARRVDAVFAKFDSDHSPGCAVAIKRNGTIVYERGYGMASLELAVPISPKTVMDVGSVSKQFTATAILLLAIDGKLALDDDARKYLPELPDVGARVTLRHLLTHTSGWRDYTDLMVLDGWDTRDHTGDREAWDAIKRVRALNFAPGSTYRYSNTGYFLLGQIVSRVSGQSLTDFARDRIFQPLGMTRTRFLPDTRAVVTGRATAYEPKDTGFVVDMSDWEQLGDGGVQTTVEDLAKWESNFDTPVVGGARLLEMLMTHGRLTDGTEIGYTAGLVRDRYRGHERVQHGGAWAGYRASIMRYPAERLAILLTCNRGDAGMPSRLRGIADIFLPPGGDAAAPFARPATGTPVAPLAGLYVSDAYGSRLSLDARGDSLFYAGDRRPLVPLGGDQFTDADGRLRLRFLAGKRVIITPVGELPDTAPMVARVSTRAPMQLAEFVGVYRGAEVSLEYSVVMHDGRLFVHLARGDDIALTPAFADAFDSDSLPTVRFVRDAGGHVVAMSFTTGGIRDVRLMRR